jgi:2-polyprenyl-3-methyl-5-hydroxy-6-metoxy-1,4-benzoquinol methylase
MEPWKERLYGSYISTGQHRPDASVQEVLQLSDYPQLTRLIRDHVPPDKDAALADLACGHGPLVFCLQQLGYRNVHGVDISSEQVALAHQLGLEHIVCQDIQSFLAGKEATLDVVFLMDILEHLQRGELFDLMDRVHGALRPGGRVIIHVPNAEGVFGMRMRYGDLTHENCFTSRSMRQLLWACGFTDIVCFEDKPPTNSAKGLVRYVLWEALILPLRVLLVAEAGTGGTKHVLSQNMLVTASRDR